MADRYDIGMKTRKFLRLVKFHFVFLFLSQVCAYPLSVQASEGDLLGQVEITNTVCPGQPYEGLLNYQTNDLQESSILQTTEMAIRSLSTEEQSRFVIQMGGSISQHRNDNANVVREISFQDSNIGEELQSMGIELPITIRVYLDSDKDITGSEYLGARHPLLDTILDTFSGDVAQAMSPLPGGLEYGSPAYVDSIELSAHGLDMEMQIDSRVSGLSDYQGRSVLAIEFAMSMDVSGQLSAESFNWGFTCLDLETGIFLYEASITVTLKETEHGTMEEISNKVLEIGLN